MFQTCDWVLVIWWCDSHFFGSAWSIVSCGTLSERNRVNMFVHRIMKLSLQFSFDVMHPWYQKSIIGLGIFPLLISSWQCSRNSTESVALACIRTITSASSFRVFWLIHVWSKWACNHLKGMNKRRGRWVIGNSWHRHSTHDISKNILEISRTKRCWNGFGDQTFASRSTEDRVYGVECKVYNEISDQKRPLYFHSEKGNIMDAKSIWRSWYFGKRNGNITAGTQTSGIENVIFPLSEINIMDITRASRGISERCDGCCAIVDTYLSFFEPLIFGVEFWQHLVVQCVEFVRESDPSNRTISSPQNLDLFYVIAGTVSTREPAWPQESLVDDSSHCWTSDARSFRACVVYLRFRRIVACVVL